MDNKSFVQQLEKIPTHVAIIPDGNRRWARLHGKPDFEGHKKGLEMMIELAKESRKVGIKYFTLWLFSTENWNRSPQEVAFLMNYAEQQIDKLGKEFIKEKVHFTHIGRKSMIPKKLGDSFSKLEQDTADFTDKYFNLAFDYGGRVEIIEAVQQMIKDGISAEEVDENLMSKYLYTSGIPDPDMIIRTSGEQRLSGYLTWQGVYSEIYFSDVFCPDYDFDEFKKALTWYSGIDSRKGGNSAIQDSKFKKIV